MGYKTLVARHSLKWHTEDLYSFLWSTQPVYVKYDRDNGYAQVVSYHEPLVLLEIYEAIHGELILSPKEIEVVDEESRD